MHLKFPAVGLLFFWTALALADDIATSLYPYIYTNLNSWPCVRLLNATSAVGCHSPITGGGVLYRLQSQDDLKKFAAERISTLEKYSVVLSYDLLTAENIQTLEDTQCVVGLLVLLRSAMDTEQLGRVLSPDEDCPNCQYGLYANDSDRHIWNPQGQGLIEKSFRIPIMGLNPTTNASIQVYNSIIKAVSYNEARGYSQYPLMAMDFKVTMWAAVNSETCIRRGWCDAVGGMSVYATPSVDMQAEDGKPIIMVTAPMDSRSLFHDLTIGANTHVAGMVSVLAVADALSKVPSAALSKHVVYSLFAAESWGFAGSQRFVQDISSPFLCTNASRAFACPYANASCSNPCVHTLDFTRVNLDKIETIIEFGSVGDASGSGYWAHVDNIAQSGSLVNNFTQSSNGLIKPAYQDGVQRKLPPSSAMSFLAKKRDIRAIVLTDYQTNMGSLYNSDVDSANDMGKIVQSVCQLATVTARTVWFEAQGSNMDQITANCTLIASLMDCLVSNFSCSFMQSYFSVSGISSISHYASVFNFGNPQPQLIPRFVFSFLADITSASKQGSCQTVQDCGLGEYCIKQKCIRSFTAYHDAYGTGLQFDEAIGKLKVVDPTKSTWTESTWDAPTMRVFLMTSRKQQIVELVVGILWSLLSVACVLASKHYLQKAFKLE
ncbi:Nicastrin-domain-containing protein [Dichotomocladium elegans]|nr:Nicastrin-domain-containing protein [Dichotomocladium elegans]